MTHFPSSAKAGPAIMSRHFTAGHFLLLAVLAALVATAVFSPGLGGGFVLDDAHTIVDNPLIQIETLDRDSLLFAASSFHVGNSTRPLAMLSFGLDYWRHGSLDAATFKTTNLVIHGLTTLLLALFVRQLLTLAQWQPQRAALCALVVALIWAVHPLQVSSVLYVVQRMQTLATLFLVLAMWAYLGLRRAQIEGQPGWWYGVLGALCWLLAMASKEDAVLLPLYLLVLELTVLRFSAASAVRTRGLRNTFAVVAAAGAAFFLFWVLPSIWSSAPHFGRDFNSVERLLTQGRVLLMYLGQIVVPWPGHMPFNYDHLAVSRGLWQPASTLLALVAVGGLLAWAWCWRTRRPVFACGVLLFFAGHVLTSNIIPLELAFEHRNHFPLIGIVLAMADLAVAGWQCWLAGSARAFIATGILVTLLVAAAGVLRAYYWGDPVRLAQHNVEIAPDSARAWLTLGGAYFDRAGRKNGRGSADLDRAIAAAEQGAKRTRSLIAYSNAVIYKTIQGTVSTADWDRFLQRLNEVPMSPQIKNMLWTMTANLRADIGLDNTKVLRFFELMAQRAELQPIESLRIGVALYRYMPAHREAALPYFLAAAAGMPPGAPDIVTLRLDLAEQGHADWASAIEQANLRLRNVPGS